MQRLLPPAFVGTDVVTSLVKRLQSRHPSPDPAEVCSFVTDVLGVRYSNVEDGWGYSPARALELGRGSCSGIVLLFKQLSERVGIKVNVLLEAMPVHMIVEIDGACFDPSLRMAPVSARDVLMNSQVGVHGRYGRALSSDEIEAVLIALEGWRLVASHKVLPETTRQRVDLLFRQALVRDTNCETALLGLAKLCSQDQAAARIYLRVALDVNPLSSWANRYLAEILESEDQAESALVLRKRAESIDRVLGRPPAMGPALR